MPLLSADELADMRAVQTDTMPDTCVIQTVARVSDGAGGYTETWAASGTVACRIAPSGLRATEVIELRQQIGANEFWRVSLPAQTSIDVDDRIVSGGKTYNVIGMEAPHSWETARIVLTHTVDT